MNDSIKIPRGDISPGQQAAMDAFHADFTALCHRHSLVAVYVLVATTGPQGSQLITGGAELLNAFVDGCIKRAGGLQ